MFKNTSTYVNFEIENCVSHLIVISFGLKVHVPPPEPEEIRPQRPIPVGQAQKHYKIIFIKAPSPPSYQAPQIPLQPQNEEKTLVYVLVKKPEEQQDIVIPTQAPTQPSKPEVYFIKVRYTDFSDFRLRNIVRDNDLFDS